MVVHTLEICSGVGMLGEGLRAGLRYLGIETRTVCHIEREAYPASVLASRIEEKSLDDAPVWSDLLTFNARAWHGAVDCIVAGFPCQDLSVAGKRVGLDGKRSGLFFKILDIADNCGAVADTSSQRLRIESHREQSSSGIDWCGLPIFAPGPNSPEWKRIIETSPWLAPSLESDFHGMVNGLAFAMDESRAQRLKCCGNGVVPTQAAVAACVLIARAKGVMQ